MFCELHCDKFEDLCDKQIINYCPIMGRHKEWRKIAKRERRRQIRQSKAKLRDNILSPSHHNYQTWIKEQKDLELFEREQTENVNRVENEKWIEAEKLAMKHWEELQRWKEKVYQKRLVQEAKLKMERELEAKKKEEEDKRIKQMKEEKIQRQLAFMEKLEQFLTGDSEEPPAELLVTSETKPNHEPCPFFTKTGCCRFGHQCSRNHQFPGISRIILATNFFSHAGLNNALDNDYDADTLLEYEYSETYKDFKEFFYDVLPEFEKHGQILQFRVCKNYEKHLRGNTYVEFAKLRCAVAAYRALNSRWFGGKRLSLQFCRINSWKAAICGLESRQRCPKGRLCNFLHVFRNPNNLFPVNYSQNQDSERRRRTPPKSWRWSESPEVEIPRIRRSRSQERTHRKSRQREERIRERKRSSNRHRRRSRPRSRRSTESEEKK